MVSNSSILPIQQRELMAAQSAMENAAAAFKATQVIGQIAAQILIWQRIALDVALVCNEEASFDQRLKASENLIKQWNPYPFDPIAQRALQYAGFECRAELRENLSLDLLSIAAKLVRVPKKWRIGRRWLKGADGTPARLTLGNLSIRNLIRALRTLAVKQYEKLILENHLPFTCHGLRDSGDTFSELSSSVKIAESFYAGPAENRLQALSPRERELVECLRRDDSLSKAAEQMNIRPSTARVLFFRIKKKLRGRM